MNGVEWVGAGLGEALATGTLEEEGKDVVAEAADMGSPGDMDLELAAEKVA